MEFPRTFGEAKSMENSETNGEFSFAIHSGMITS